MDLRAFMYEIDLRGDKLSTSVGIKIGAEQFLYFKYVTHIMERGT